VKLYGHCQPQGIENPYPEKPLESSWDFSALHAELGAGAARDLSTPGDNDGVLWCASCCDGCGCSWR
jgi:hypothetical protein